MEIDFLGNHVSIEAENFFERLVNAKCTAIYNIIRFQTYELKQECERSVGFFILINLFFNVEQKRNEVDLYKVHTNVRYSNPCQVWH